MAPSRGSQYKWRPSALKPRGFSFDDPDRDSTEDSRYDTDLTEPEDEEDEDQLRDAGDAALLFADNEHPPEYYIQQLENFDKTIYTQEDYGKGTTALLDRVEEKWSQFCAFLRKDPQEEFTRLSVAILYNFLDWVLNLRHGKNGRRLPGIKCKSSLDTFWKVFRLVYEKETCNKIGKQMNRRMRRVIRQLAKKHNLSLKGRDKPPLDVKDLAKVVETTISTTEKKFRHGRYHIELGLFLQLAGLTTNRPQAILNLRYRHIQVSLLRDPQGGPHRIVIEFTFEFTKEWLGAKDANTYILPEIIYDPSLVLMDGEEVLVSAGQLPGLQIREEYNELPLQLDSALNDVPVFRMSDSTLQGISISPNEPLPYSTLLPWVKTIGAITGFRQVTRPYSLRYGAGTALDSSGSVSDSMRNLIMRHADTRTFLHYYLSRRINKNLPAIIRGLDPEDDLMRAACRMSRTLDPNRPRRLTTAQSESVNLQLEIVDLVRRRDELSRQMGRPLSKHEGTQEYLMHKKLNQEITGARQRARDALLSQIQAKYNREQPMREIQRQLSGVKLVEVEKPLKCSEEVPAPQKRLMESLLTLPRPTLEEEIARRTEAIDAVAAYSLFEEGDTCRLPRDKRSPRGGVAVVPAHQDGSVQDAKMTENNFFADDSLQAAIQSVMKDRSTIHENKGARKKVERLLFCFICLGQPDLDIKKRTYKFSSPGDVTKHIKRKHLQYISVLSDISCNICDKRFSCKMHLQRHAIDVHATVT
ncbi:hypothetical protein BDW75DRAFT_235532 [Aspergillus navahoensis]